MEAQALQDIILKILRSELNETEPEDIVKAQLTSEEISALFSLSKRHDLAHIVSQALYKCGLLTDQEMLSKFSRAEMMSVYRNEQIKYAYKQICDCFDESDIPYIPLKGSVIRPYYPKESMRTSCDIDILIKEENLDNAINILVQKGFKCGKKNYHDVSLYSPNKIHLELHFNIQEKIDSLDIVLKDAWEHAELIHGSRYEFSKEFFMFHIFAHMSYHFLSGGCGVRSLMDIWIIKHKMGIDYTEAKSLLKKAGIYQFAEEINNLVDVCFSDKPKDDFSKVLLSYIFNGGVYGTMQNQIIVKKSRNNSMVIYVLKKFFLPYKDMKAKYPVLQKCPFLLPLCWIRRLFEIIFGGKVIKSVPELKTANEVTNGEVEIMRQIRQRLGLK